MNTNKRTEYQNADWHREDIKAELNKRGISMAKLGRDNGLAPTTVKNALDKHYPKGEKLIADALGVKATVIWPSRYTPYSAKPIERVFSEGGLENMIGKNSLTYLA